MVLFSPFCPRERRIHHLHSWDREHGPAEPNQNQYRSIQRDNECLYFMCLYLPVVCKRCLILWSVVNSKGFFPSEFLDVRSAPCSNSSSTSFAPPTLVAACKGVSRPRPHCTSAPWEKQEAMLKFPPIFFFFYCNFGIIN